VEARLSKLKLGMTRLIDSYAEGLIDKSEFEPRIKDLRERSARLESQAKELANQATMENELRLIVSSIEQFMSNVNGALEEADWATKRDIIRALVRRVEVEKGQVNIVFRVNPLPFDSRPERGVLQHCWLRNSATLGTRRWVLAATPMMQHSNLAGDWEIESHLHRGRNPESRCIV